MILTVIFILTTLQLVFVVKETDTIWIPVVNMSLFLMISNLKATGFNFLKDSFRYNTHLTTVFGIFFSIASLLYTLFKGEILVLCNHPFLTIILQGLLLLINSIILMLAVRIIEHSCCKLSQIVRDESNNKHQKVK